jgi:hypothetical protein
MQKNLAFMNIGTPVNAVNATKTLTLTGVVIDGETVTINHSDAVGTDIYEFMSDTAQTKTTATNKAVNISSYAAKSTGTLTLATQPTANDTMTIGTKVYTFVASGTTPANGKIVLGTNLAATKLVVVKAINGSTDTANSANSKVTASAFASDICTLTAIDGGLAGNTIATTETFTANDNVFGGAVLGSGGECSAANAVTALIAAITSSDTQGVGATAGAGTSVVLTADVAGAAGNKVLISKSMANATFAGSATKLSGGIDGTEGPAEMLMHDSSYLYVLTADNTKAGKNWRRISIGSAF